MLRTPLRALALLVGASLGSAHARADLLYVSSNLNNLNSAAAITRIDTTTGVQTPFVTTLPGGNGGNEPLALDSSGNLYVGVQPSSGTPFIEKYTPAGVGSLYATLLPGTLSPSGLAFDASGNLFVANFSGGAIEKVAPGGGAGSVTPFATVTNPFGLAISPLNGNLFTVSGTFGSGGIQQITPGGIVSSFFGLGSGNCELAFDAAGNLYVTGSTREIDKITPTGVRTPFATAVLPDVNGVQGMAFDAAGNLYVSAQGGLNIARIAPNGTSSPFATISFSSLQFIAIQPSSGPVVPEPGSLSLLGLGLSGLAAWSWRRWRAAQSG
jgi:streptogramin lyase